MNKENTKEIYRSGVSLTLNKEYSFVLRQVSPDLQTTVLFPSPLAGEGGWRPGEEYTKENNFITHPSSVCWNFVPQTTSPARGEVKRLGFTLIELLVVVLIIGILVAVALPQYQKAVEKSRMAEAITLLRAIANANQVFFVANGRYAAENEMDLLDVEIPGTPKTSGDKTTAIQTKYFEYSTKKETHTTPEIAVAYRIEPRNNNVTNLFYLYILSTEPERVQCYIVNQNTSPVTSAQRKLCEDINSKGIL